MDTDYDPEEREPETGKPKKRPKKKETRDPGLTMGTDIEDELRPDQKQVEIELSKVRMHQERTKGQIRRKDARLMQKCIELLEAARPTRPIHVVSNRLFVVLVARALAHGPVFYSQMAIIGVYLDSTALKQF